MPRVFMLRANANQTVFVVSLILMRLISIKYYTGIFENEKNYFFSITYSGTLVWLINGIKAMAAPFKALVCTISKRHLLVRAFFLWSICQLFFVVFYVKHGVLFPCS